MNAAFKTIISGRVQGVGFRYFTELQARELNIHGYVKNRPDGRVEVHAEGDKDHLQSFLDRLKEGPRTAHVDDMDTEWLPYDNEFSGFTTH